jgi:serine/threonine protein kinase
MIEAFKILSKNNIMHRDLKPDNILMHNGKIKLGDFGFCKPLESAT